MAITADPTLLATAREQFAPAGTYLNTASVGLAPRCTTDALRADLDRWAAGAVQPADYDAAVAASRASFARLIGVPADWVAIGSQVSAMAGLVAASLPAGSEVVCADDDFASVLFPFMAQQDRGVRVRSVPLASVADAVGPATTLVSVSVVQSADGALADLDAVAAAAAAHGATTFIDATQSCGWLPIDGSRFDFVAVSAYKWLMAPRGAALWSVRPDRLAAIRPHSAGWYAGEDPWQSLYGGPLRLAPGSRRLDVSPAWSAWIGAEASLGLIESIGVEAIHEHDTGLADALLERLDLEPQGSAICSLEVSAAAGDRLAAAGVCAARRDGRLRLGFHLHNTMDDVERVAGLLC